MGVGVCVGARVVCVGARVIGVDVRSNEGIVVPSLNAARVCDDGEEGVDRRLRKIAASTSTSVSTKYP